MCLRREFRSVVVGQFFCGREAKAGGVVYGARQNCCILQFELATWCFARVLEG